MTTLLIALLSGVGFLVAYHTYGRWLGSKIFRLSADAICPSERLKDGVDYVPTSGSMVLFRSCDVENEVTPAAPSASLGAIVGGSVGGGVALIAVLGAAAAVMARRRSAAQPQGWAPSVAPAKPSSAGGPPVRTAEGVPVNTETL